MHELFKKTGAHVLVDGQFGSTGKGVLAAWLASKCAENGQWPYLVISNAGPNSGHTFYHGDEKVVLKQLPTFAVAAAMMGKVIPIYLSAGAVIDPAILIAEAHRHRGPIFIHPNAAVITDADKESEHSGSVAAVAGTRSGTGAALARKVLRDPSVTMKYYSRVNWLPDNVQVRDYKIDWADRMIFVEVSQGFSLGLNQKFYPKCTSRECTVSQALSDAGIPPQGHAVTYMSARTFPIRVGNVDDHSSGDWYPDQEETTWAELGVTPELTTVTKRERRVATFSRMQFLDATHVNAPNFVFLNFLNYLSPKEQVRMKEVIAESRHRCLQHFEVIGCDGPKSENVHWLNW